MAKCLLILFCTVVFFSCNSREDMLAERDARIKQAVTERMKWLFRDDQVDSIEVVYVDSASHAELLKIQKEPYLRDKNSLTRQLSQAEEMLREYKKGLSYMNKAEAEELAHDIEKAKKMLQPIAAMHDSMARDMESESAQEFAGFIVRVKYSVTSIYKNKSGEKIFLIDKNNKVLTWWEN